MTANVHVQDTLTGGYGLADTALLWGSPIAVIETREWRVPTMSTTEELIDRVLHSLPPVMSEHHVQQLRKRYPAIMAADDTATLEFVSG